MTRLRNQLMRRNIAKTVSTFPNDDFGTASKVSIFIKTKSILEPTCSFRTHDGLPYSQMKKIRCFVFFIIAHGLAAKSIDIRSFSSISGELGRTDTVQLDVQHARSVDITGMGAKHFSLISDKNQTERASRATI